jgi:hypothetical protein
MDEIFVTVARVGAPSVEVCLNGNHTVLDACRAANISPKSTEAYKVDGDEVDADYEMSNGERLVLTKNIEGGR